MNAVPNIPIGDLMAESLGSVDPSKYPQEVFDLYSIPAFDKGHPEVIVGSSIGSPKQTVRPYDVLLSRIVPHIRRAWVVGKESGRRIIASGEWIVFRSERVDPNYLRHVLLGDQFHAQFMNTVSGVGGSLLRARPAHVAKIKIPLPPLPQQRRIAALLGKAESLRSKRGSSIAKLDTLNQAIFLDIFGDPATNPKGWGVTPLRNVLSMALRNGLSPSHSGKVVAKVLTLTAVTGNQFNESAWKISTFQSLPPDNQSVDRNDFLICRGNGNIRLVGKGHFPINRMSDVTFPDTMIAARINEKQIDRHFLEHIWNSTAIRKQIESLARTTNGTFKVNQTMLEGITFFCPPIELQYEFGLRVSALDKVKSAHLLSMVELESLFNSLQDRAFRGELGAVRTI